MNSLVKEHLLIFSIVVASGFAVRVSVRNSKKESDASLQSTSSVDAWSAGNQCLSIGTNVTPTGYKLAVKGKVIAESVKVKLYNATDWSDYVFDKGYRLTPLPEVKAYVDKNHHLSDIPSATEIVKEGLDLGEINKLLTKKVEELTLYVIEKDEEIKDSKKELDIQNKKIEKLQLQMDILLKKIRD